MDSKTPDCFAFGAALLLSMPSRIRDPEKMRAASRRHYAKNRQAVIARNRVRSDRLAKDNIAFIREYRASHPCVDCGETDPIVLDFDHRNPSEKVFCVTRGMARYSRETLMAELAKCDIRCANCHRRKSHRDRCGERPEIRTRT